LKEQPLSLGLGTLGLVFAGEISGLPPTCATCGGANRSLFARRSFVVSHPSHKNKNVARVGHPTVAARLSR
jgi:hypothetical protein